MTEIRIAARDAALELNRFRGHLILWKGRESRNANAATARISRHGREGISFYEGVAVVKPPAAAVVARAYLQSVTASQTASASLPSFLPPFRVRGHCRSREIGGG
jgi:hypothetical protein